MKIEGKNPVFEVLNSGLNIDKLLIQSNLKQELSKIIRIAINNRVKIQYVDKLVLDKHSEKGHHQGVICFATDYYYSSVDEILNFAEQKGESPFIVLCDEISDPHNLGSLIRTCECAGVHGMIISKNRSCPVNETVIKVSTGAAFNLKIAMVNNLNDCIRDLKKKNIFIYALEAGGNSIYKTNLTGAIGLIVGSEGFGISKLTKELADDVISLPMFGKINSLNASIAGGICVYEAVKQRNNI